MRYEDDELEESFPLDLMVDVDNIYTTIKLPDLPEIKLDDTTLEYFFNYPEAVEELCKDEEKSEFWNSIIPHVLRIRNVKREFYAEAGF